MSRYDSFELSWGGINRLFRVAERLLELGGELDKFEMATYRYMLHQLDEFRIEHLAEKYPKAMSAVRAY